MSKRCLHINLNFSEKVQHTITLKNFFTVFLKQPYSLSSTMFNSFDSPISCILTDTVNCSEA